MANKDREAVNSGLSDLLGNVIRSDRERAGRGRPEVSVPVPDVSLPTPAEAPAPIETEPPIVQAAPATSEQSDTKTLTHYDTMTNGVKREETPSLPRPTVPPKRKGKTPVVAQSTDAASRVETAQEMAESSTMTVTLRIPQEFNAWLDEYVHGSWPHKVRKQELVTEALKMLYARRGRPKEEIISTPLLGEEAE